MRHILRLIFSHAPGAYFLKFRKPTPPAELLSALLCGAHAKLFCDSKQPFKNPFLQQINLPKVKNPGASPGGAIFIL